MNNDQETIIAALYSHLVSNVTPSFTGDATSGNATIANVSSVAGLVVGLPVFGVGVPPLAVIDSFDATTVTLDQKLTSAGAAVAFTAGCQTLGRRVVHWSKVSDQPALFLTHTGAEDEFNQIIFARTTIEAEIWLYSRAGQDPGTAPDIALNALVNLVRAALAPDNAMTNTLTLGGLCQWCRIEGKSEYDPGDQDAQSKAVLPIRILMP